HGYRPAARLHRTLAKHLGRKGPAAARVPGKPAGGTTRLCICEGCGREAHCAKRSSYRKASKAKAEIPEQEEQEPEVDRQRHASNLDARRDERDRAKERRLFDQIGG